jgi:O-succinylbenzoic acid--CoA ligase
VVQAASWRTLGLTTRGKDAAVTGRRVRALTVPTGRTVLDLLPDLARALDGSGPALLPLSPSDPRAAGIAGTLRAGEPLGPGEDDPSDPTALVLPTSGSTGSPKGVLLPAGALAASAAATHARLGGPGNWLLALPAWHIAGLQVLLRAAAGGGEPVVLDAAEPFTADRFVAAAAAVPGPRRYVSLVPTQLRRVLDDPAAREAARELFDAVLVGGSATPAALLSDARAAGIAVITTYGMTETCGGCVYDGRPLDGVTVTIDPAGAPAPAAARVSEDESTGADTRTPVPGPEPARADVGRIVLTGAVVARGYRGLPGHPAFARRGSFVTADAGLIGADGTLSISGRLDDMIVSGGVNVPPAAVERALLALPAIADAVVVGVPDEQWGQAVTALVVPAGSTVPTLPQVRSALTDLPAAHRPRRLLAVGAIPMLASGKPDREAARRIARDRAAKEGRTGSAAKAGRTEAAAGEGRTEAAAGSG